MSISFAGKKKRAQSAEVVAKRSKYLLGNKWNKGRKPTQETLQKRSMALKGRVFSDQHKQKLSEAWKKRKQKFCTSPSSVSGLT